MKLSSVQVSLIDFNDSRQARVDMSTSSSLWYFQAKHCSFHPGWCTLASQKVKRKSPRAVLCQDPNKCGLLKLTRVICENECTGSECALSISYAVAYPFASQYLRTWLPRLVLNEPLSRCQDELGVLGTLTPTFRFSPEGKSRLEAVLLFQEIDKDQDLYLNEGEISDHLIAQGMQPHFQIRGWPCKYILIATICKL